MRLMVLVCPESGFLGRAARQRQSAGSARSPIGIRYWWCWC